MATTHVTKTTTEVITTTIEKAAVTATISMILSIAAIIIAIIAPIILNLNDNDHEEEGGLMAPGLEFSQKFAYTFFHCSQKFPVSF